MGISVFLSDIYHLENIPEVMEIPPKVRDAGMMDSLDANARVNILSLVELMNHFPPDKERDTCVVIDRIYFGSETCERLIPSQSEMKKAVELCRENGYDFTLVTPICGSRGIQALVPLFDFLNTLQGTEIVINDFGVLHLLNQKYPNLVPCLGRLLVKMNRDPRFSKSEYSFNETGVERPSETRKTRNSGMQRSSLEISQYQDFLRKRGIARVGVDMTPQGINLKKGAFGSKQPWGFPLDLYWPWTYVTSSRTCFLAQWVRGNEYMHPTEAPCNRLCRDYGFNFSSDKEMFDTIQRGNAIWMNSLPLTPDYFNSTWSRLIYQPYIPV